MKFNKNFSPMVTLIIIGTILGASLTMGWNGLTYSIIFAVVLGVLEGVSFKTRQPKQRSKYGME